MPQEFGFGLVLDFGWVNRRLQRHNEFEVELDSEPKIGSFLKRIGSESGGAGPLSLAPPLFGEKSLKTVCYHLCIFKPALKWTRSVRLRAF